MSPFTFAPELSSHHIRLQSLNLNTRHLIMCLLCKLEGEECFSNFRPLIQFGRHWSPKQLLKPKMVCSIAFQVHWRVHLIGQNPERRFLLYQGLASRREKEPPQWLLILTAHGEAWQQSVCGGASGVKGGQGWWGCAKACHDLLAVPWLRCRITSLCILSGVRPGKKDTQDGNTLWFANYIKYKRKMHPESHLTVFNSPSQCATGIPFSGPAILLPLRTQKVKGVIIPQEHLNCSI